MSDIDTVAVNSLKALDPNRPIREADITQCGGRGNSSMMASTAAEAFERFERAINDDLAGKFFCEGQTTRLRPSGILRVLGDELKGASDCPTQIMPLWLAKAFWRGF